ncbi:MAG: tRNA (pseudouridine(54)-N(1))-methyltransferase TrmY [Methanobacteriota archaeon]
MREFVFVAHRVPRGGDFTLNDLTGAGGRVDLVARSVGAALLLSHGIRRDTLAHVIINTNPAKPRHICFDWEKVRYLNPDERNGASLIRNALMRCPAEGDVESSPGVTVARRGLPEILEKASKPLVLLAEGAPAPDWKGLSGGATFILSDQQDLTAEELAIVEKAGATRAGLGERCLHTDHCVTVVNYRLDAVDGT